MNPSSHELPFDLPLLAAPNLYFQSTLIRRFERPGWIPWILNPWRIHEIQKTLKLTIYKAKLSQRIKEIQGSQGLRRIQRIQRFIAFSQQCLNPTNSESLRNPRKSALLKESKKSLDSSDSLKSLTSLNFFDSLT
jgi:hypothetical protein